MVTCLSDAQRKLLVRLVIAEAREEERSASGHHDQSFAALTKAGAESWLRKSSEAEGRAAQARELAALDRGRGVGDGGAKACYRAPSPAR